MKVRTQQNETLDALIWRHYGYTRGMTEQVLMVNHGLADLGPILPHGILVELPELTPAVTTKTLRLWE